MIIDVYSPVEGQVGLNYSIRVLISTRRATYDIVFPLTRKGIFLIKYGLFMKTPAIHKASGITWPMLPLQPCG